MLLGKGSGTFSHEHSLCSCDITGETTLYWCKSWNYMMQWNYPKIMLVIALSFPEAALQEEAEGSWS